VLDVAVTWGLGRCTANAHLRTTLRGARSDLLRDPEDVSGRRVIHHEDAGMYVHGGLLDLA
jgi:hypothetical protein